MNGPRDWSPQEPQETKTQETSAHRAGKVIGIFFAVWVVGMIMVVGTVLVARWLF